MKAECIYTYCIRVFCAYFCLCIFVLPFLVYYSMLQCLLSVEVSPPLESKCIPFLNYFIIFYIEFLSDINDNFVRSIQIFMYLEESWSIS